MTESHGDESRAGPCGRWLNSGASSRHCDGAHAQEPGDSGRMASDATVAIADAMLMTWCMVFPSRIAK